MSDNGFEKKANGLTIDKDVQAELSYAFDWMDWLPVGDELFDVEYSVQARLNDPNPIIIVGSGIAVTQTYVVLAGGQINKAYKVSCKITTAAGLVDRRTFTVLVKERSA